MGEIRVQIIDDSLLMRRKMIQIVEHLGYTVVAVAKDGQKAILQYEAILPDIVFLDADMPDHNGIKTLQAMVAKFYQPKIIMISSLNQKTKVIEALRNGAKHFMVKPFRIENLKEAVELVLKEDEEGLKS